jgi:hypothetical protein
VPGEGGLQETIDLAAEHVVAVSTSGSLREDLARHCPDKALHLGLVVVVVHAGADERV